MGMGHISGRMDKGRRGCPAEAVPACPWEAYRSSRPVTPTEIDGAAFISPSFQVIGNAREARRSQVRRARRGEAPEQNRTGRPVDWEAEPICRVH